MSKFRISLLLAFFYLLGANSAVFAQQNLIVNHYSKPEFPGGSQNWSVSISNEGTVHIANNKGLIVIDRKGQSLFQTPDKLSVRSVKAHKNTIYTGSFEEMGLWERDKKNKLVYKSLTPLLGSYALKNDEFWKIAVNDSLVYFQSFGSIFRYNGKDMRALKLPGTVLLILEAANRLFVQQIDGQLFEIIDDQILPIDNTAIFADTEVKSMIALDNERFLVGTSSKGLFIWDGKSIEPWNKAAIDSSLIRYKLNNGIRVGVNTLAFGTIQNGLFLIDLEGNIIDHINTNNGLQNNTVLALHATKEGNLWAGLDQGLDFIWLESPVQRYIDTDQTLGAVYTAALLDQKLYVGTNQGVFVYDQLQKNSHKIKPKFIEGTQGQCWFLKVVDAKLYAGLNEGTFLIEDDTAQKIGFFDGGFNLEKSTLYADSLLWQSTYGPLLIYHKRDEVWQQKTELKGVSGPFRQVVFDHTGNIILGHLQKGLYLARPNTKLDSLFITDTLGTEFPQKWANKVYEVENRIIIPSGEKLYQWDPIISSLNEFETLNSQLNGFEKAKTIIKAGAHKYWFAKPNELGLFEIRFEKAQLLYHIMPGLYGIDMIEGFENVVTLNDSLYAICGESGFALLNLFDLHRFNNRPSSPDVYKIAVKNAAGQTENILDFGNSETKVSEKWNSISFHFSTEQAVGQKTYYRYKLEGLDTEWSDWTASTSIAYDRLPSKSYSFKLKSLSVSGVESEVYSLDVQIIKAWYKGELGLLLAFILLIGAIFLANWFWNKRLLQRNQLAMEKDRSRLLAEKEHAEAEILKIMNDKLKHEVSDKTSQLAKNTMLVSRKNEALVGTRDKLLKLKEDLGYRLPAKKMDAIVNQINKNLDTDHDWESFELLFDQAHDNFFKRLKNSFPDLTASELRLCAYLRMGLSSKEIAPLLNITIRGVEEKRYRLRKRIELSSEQGLTEFIMNF